jgi:N-acetylmuramic acid 6-phosphate etherase
MVDVKPSNFKLVDRARRIFRTVLPETTLSNSEIDSLIESCQHNVKRALVVERHKCSTSEAESILSQAGGVLKRALQLPDYTASDLSTPTLSSQVRLVLCIDAGGTKCNAVIANENGMLFRGEAGPCNL